MSFFDIDPNINYNNIDKEFKDPKFQEMLRTIFVENPYLYKLDRKILYDGVQKYRNADNESLFSFFESPSKQSFQQFLELILKFSNLNNYVFGNLISHFLLLAIYRFVKTKQDIFFHMDVIAKENIEQTTIIESITREKKTILEKHDHDNKITFLKITTQNSEIIQLKQKLKELEKK